MSELVSLTIDDKKVSVPKGTNLIEAVKLVNSEIPHYCYHPDLSVAGNCRICQVEIVGQPKLQIACNTKVQDGMQVKTHHSSQAVVAAQKATLEFMLINHPLDCTICDQAGHCKLQDYHYEYNAESSRFTEEKVHKAKAEPLGETVVLDGERCIMCTRCVRFCSEVTKTNELGMINRGDKAEIAIFPDKPLSNPLSGTVVDLCPVGALTHTKWRFNTRIWFTEATSAICPGCSTGCNVQLFERDGKVVNVKARLNPFVNKEWLCDEGRYGFDRFLPKVRALKPVVNGEESTLKEALKVLAGVVKSGNGHFLFSSSLTLEDYLAFAKILEDTDNKAYLFDKRRTLTETEAILISDDYSANWQGFLLSGLLTGCEREDLSILYKTLIANINDNKSRKVIVLVGDILEEDESLSCLKDCEHDIILITTNAEHPLYERAKVVIPTLSIVEKSGILVNKDLRAQYTRGLVAFREGSADLCGEGEMALYIAKEFLGVDTGLESMPSRWQMTKWVNANFEPLAGVSIAKLSLGYLLTIATREDTDNLSA